MYHPVLLGLVRFEAVAQMEQLGLSRTDARHQADKLTLEQIADVIRDAKGQAKVSLPDEAFEHDAATGAAGFPDGHRMKQLKAWMDAHPDFVKAMKIALSILITILISGS